MIKEIKKVIQKINGKVTITGIIALVILELYALNKGINGVMLTTVIGIIALAIGVGIPTPKGLRK